MSYIQVITFKLESLEEPKLHSSIRSKIDESMDLCNESHNSSSFFSSLTSGEMNKMRRMVALSSNSSCYTRLLPMFVNHTLHRIDHIHNHLNLHIPKSGGTSMCSLATHKSKNNANFTIPPIFNCWEYDHFLPLWMHPEFEFVPGADRSEWLSSAASLCNAMDRKLPTFVMNENYLDHPLCTQHRIYSIVIRDPVDRAMSNERHLLTFGRKYNNEISYSLEERLQLIRNNYMVWALSSGTTTHGTRLSVLPQREHLEIAMEALLQFDYILDVAHTTTSCHDDILYLMGLTSNREGEKPPHEMGGQGKEIKLPLSRNEYKELNLLDSELYENARSVMRVDCEFYSHIRELIDMRWVGELYDYEAWTLLL